MDAVVVLRQWTSVRNRSIDDVDDYRHLPNSDDGSVEGVQREKTALNQSCRRAAKLSCPESVWVRSKHTPHRRLLEN